jgi:hypothetical protein
MLGSAADNHLDRLVIKAVVFEKFLGNRLTEFRDAGAGSVFGATILKGFDSSRLDVFRSVHVGLTGAEAINFDAFGFHGLGLAVNGKRERWCELLKSGRCFHEKNDFVFGATLSRERGKVSVRCAMRQQATFTSLIQK